MAAPPPSLLPPPVSPLPPAPSIIPAQLGFLAIYNPSLSSKGGGGEDESSVNDQIVYYASLNEQHASSHEGGSSSRRRRRRHRSSTQMKGDGEQISKEIRNERLRQVGLAQGMVEFSRGFAGGKAVEGIETEKRRVVVYELEPGWWILASIDLTQLPSAATATAEAGAERKTEYSSREVKPTSLLLQDLLRAHSVFLLHHASSLSALFVKTQREKFVAVLGRYWDLFLSTWNVMLHGNPACAVFGGIKIAACGELGIGVGEEERGSGEREVLEGLVERTEGLVDLVVGRFGKALSEDDPENEEEEKWLGTGTEPGAEDGAVFLGTGALSRNSLRALTSWMEDMYIFGENAYGVNDSPAATRSQASRRRRAAGRKAAADKESRKQQQQLDGSNSAGKSGEPSKAADEAEKGSMDTLFGYMKLGYGTSWSLGGKKSDDTTTTAEAEPSASGSNEQQNPTHTETPKSRQPSLSAGRYLIGLMGDVEESLSKEDDPDAQDQAEPAGLNSRTLLRTVSVELEQVGEDRPESKTTKDLGSQDTELADEGVAGKEGHVADTSNTEFDSQDRNKTKKLRVVVYANRPFIYIFLFQLRTDSLAWDGMYKSLHTQLAPLHRPLLSSTAYRPERPDVGAAATAQIYDLVWDPKLLTIHSTIPNIPEPVSAAAAPGVKKAGAWTRVESLNTHNQILNVYSNTRDDLSEFERTCKTSRGWWIVWTRILERSSKNTDGSLTPTTTTATSTTGTATITGLVDGHGSSDDGGGGEEEGRLDEAAVTKEIILIRRASDHGGGGLRGVSTSYITTGTGGGGGGGGGWADGASRLAQGIGVDTRRYIEGLLSLNR
ncbi:hypothetical protein QBC40DRAFT_323819 [Triangularia verruculosa]|uniref:CCZ1/INTU/HSP4 first Longin domain-containing protein n=1 Tax=Triangularia verruculosa TaxID=2587418 RepID=A0AAN6XJ77_9PEZI|nr:hypothetical protein QBC40DRAFT_323819 [Triangularia verruculosa]